MTKYTQEEAKLIEQLKSNTKPWGLLSHVERDMLNEAGFDVQVYSDSGDWIMDNDVWQWHKTNTYRIHPDFKYEVIPPKPSQEWLDKYNVEIVEYTYIDKGDGRLYYWKADKVPQRTWSLNTQVWIVRKKEDTSWHKDVLQWHKDGVLEVNTHFVKYHGGERPTDKWRAWLKYCSDDYGPGFSSSHNWTKECFRKAGPKKIFKTRPFNQQEWAALRWVKNADNGRILCNIEWISLDTIKISTHPIYTHAEASKLVVQINGTPCTVTEEV